MTVRGRDGLIFGLEDVESIVFDSGLNTQNIPDKSSPQVRTEGNSTIITVGQTKPEITEPDKDPVLILENKRSAAAQPIVLRTPVLADNTANGWTNTGCVVKKGQKIKITGTGRVSLGNGRYTRPEGIATLPDSGKLLRINRPAVLSP